jgi:hypothetical protein
MGVAHRHHRLRADRVPAGALSALEFALLGPLAAVLVLVAIPRAFAIESACLGELGAVSTEGDSYTGAFVALGTLGWLGVFVGVILASIAERPAIVIGLPVLWFAVLVLAALAVAAVIGPVACPT